MKTNTVLLTLLALMLALTACNQPTSVPIPTATTEPVPANLGTIPVTVDISGMAQSVTSEVVPAVPASASGPMSAVMPEYTLLTLQGYAVAKSAHTPQILVIRVSDLGVNATAAKAAADLQTLLQNQQAGVTLPYLPIYNEKQMLHAQVKFLDFRNGKGVRFVTEWSQGLIPVNNRQLIYTFQGLTSDGKYFVAVVLPLNLAELPADEMSTSGLPADFPNNYTQYLSDTAARLDQQAAGAFTPDLSKLDAMMQSIEVK